MKTIKDVFDMINLFYANKHYYDRLKRQHEERRQEDHARVAKMKNGRQFKSPYVGVM